ncbi:MAG TPA: FG-GAP repeat protein [Trebonia sp.]|nr:FG-GAP repeat protein [Trebonia sp.]
MRTSTHLVRRGAYAAVLAVLAAGVASAPALAATTSPTTLAPSDGVTGDLFGESTATSTNGAVTAVGSPEHNSSGAVYVFTGTGTAASQSAELTPSNPQADEQFGQTVAISGDGQTLVAAAPGAAGTSGSDQGAAYVFSDTSGTWTQIAELTVPGTAELGTSLAISADASTIVLGSPTSNNDNGEAFVFTKSGSTYVQTQELTEAATSAPAATSAKVPTRAGSAVSAARKPKPAPAPTPAPSVPAFLGDNTAISADGSTIAFGEPNVGVTDVFTKAAGATTWTQTAQLHGGGDSVAVSSKGTIVAAGQTGINNLNGAVFVFTESGGTFTEASEVLPPANTTIAADAAGSNVGMSADGSIIAFGAPTATAGSALESGEVFVATESSTGTWALSGTDNEPNPVSDDDLGGGDQSVAVAGNGSAIVAGARAANGQTGQAIVFPVS